MRAAAALALTLALTSCSAGIDVVARARATDAGDGPVPDAGDGSAKSPACAEDAPMIVATSSALYRFDITRPSKAENLGATCIEGPISAIAVDRQRAIWVVSNGKLVIFDQDTHQCRPTDVTVSPSAMAFVWAPNDGQESLYAVVDGVLVVFGASLRRTPIEKLPSVPVRGLAGTNDGRLLGFVDDMPDALEVSLGDASMTPRWTFGGPDFPMSGVFRGVVSAQGLLVVADAQIYRYERIKDVSHLDAITNLDSDIVSVSTAPCWPPPR